MLAQRLAHQRADREVRHVVVVHHVEVDQVGAGGEHGLALLRRAARSRRTGSTEQSTGVGCMDGTCSIIACRALRDAARRPRGSAGSSASATFDHRLGQAVRDELVGMILAHQPAIGLRDLGVGRRARHAEHLVGLRERDCDRARPPRLRAVAPEACAACAAAPPSARTQARHTQRCADAREHFAARAGFRPPPHSAVSQLDLHEHAAQIRTLPATRAAARAAAAPSGKSRALALREQLDRELHCRARRAGTRSSSRARRAISSSRDAAVGLRDVTHRLERGAEERSCTCAGLARRRAASYASIVRRALSACTSNRVADERAEQLRRPVPLRPRRSAHPTLCPAIPSTLW